ncbi:MAG: YkuJ family protein [Lactobacillales bacterium]|jgi:uncharacterized protein YkuJ|nr:YkuJ family protein [Lactobacillales bacterium]
MKSQLKAIIDRLEAMMRSTDNEKQVRRFEKDGKLKAEITYDISTSIFILKYIDNDEVGEFDDLDLVAMEIYDLLF